MEEHLYLLKPHHLQGVQKLLWNETWQYQKPIIYKVYQKSYSTLQAYTENCLIYKVYQ